MLKITSAMSEEKATTENPIKNFHVKINPAELFS